MIQIYHGDGKGKTTAATGLAIRATGRGVPVIFVQFLKDGSSGEISVLNKLEGIDVLKCECFYGFVRNMTQEQMQETKKAYRELIGEIDDKISKLMTDSLPVPLTAANADELSDIKALIILDEILHAINSGLIDEGALINHLEGWKKVCDTDIEIVLTGMGPSEKLLELADYVTEMKKQKHPFDKGIYARYGVEL